MRRLAPALLCSLLACGGNSKTCTITDEGDGTSTIACPGGPSLRVASKDTQVVCTASDAPDGIRQILCSDGTAVELSCHVPIDGTKKVCQPIFPGGGSVTGNASLFGLGAVAGIVVRAGKGETRTDAEGNYLLEGLDAGIYNITFEYPDYGTQTRTNTPSVGLPWRIDPVVLYPAWQIGNVAPSWARLSPDENALLTFKTFSRDVGALSIWDLTLRVSTPLSSDAVPPTDPAFAADGSVVFVEASTDPPLIVVRAPDGSRRTHSGATAARFFGSQVLFQDLTGELAIWDPATDAVTIVDHGKTNVLSRVIDVVPGEALLYQPTEAMVWSLWSKTSGLRDFSDVPPKVAGGNAVGARGIDSHFVSWIHGADRVREEVGIRTDGFDLSPDGKSAWLYSVSSLRVKQLASGSDGTASTLFSPCLPDTPPTGTCLLQFSPDGSLLAFVDRGKSTEVGGPYFLRVMDARTLAVRTIEPTEVTDLVFAGADHQTLVYVALPSNTPTGPLKMLRPGQTKPATLLDDSNSFGLNLKMSRNGAYVAYAWAAAENNTELRRLNVASGSSTVVADYVADYDISPSGKNVIYRAVAPGTTMPQPGDGQVKLFRGSSAPLTLGAAAGVSPSPVWPGDDDSFLEVQPSAAPSFYDAAQGKLLPLDDTSAQVLTFSRRHVVYAVTDSTGTRTGLHVVYLP